MTVTTPPAVSEAMREAVARKLCTLAGLNPDGKVALIRMRFPYLNWQMYLAGAEDLLSEGPLASEIARLTGEREVAEMLLERRKVDLRAAEAETARLRAERDGLQAIVLADDAKALAEYEWERANKLADDNLRLVTEAAELREALRGVIRVADRKTVEFDRARAALSSQEQADV